MRDRVGLGRGQRGGDVAGRGGGIQPRNDGVLVDAGDDDERIDSGLAQHLATARRGRREDHPGHFRMCVRSSSVTRCQLKVA